MLAVHHTRCLGNPLVLTSSLLYWLMWSLKISLSRGHTVPSPVNEAETLNLFRRATCARVERRRQYGNERMRCCKRVRATRTHQEALALSNLPTVRAANIIMLRRTADWLTFPSGRPKNAACFMARKRLLYARFVFYIQTRKSRWSPLFQGGRDRGKRGGVRIASNLHKRIKFYDPQLKCFATRRAAGNFCSIIQLWQASVLFSRRISISAAWWLSIHCVRHIRHLRGRPCAS